MLFQDHGWSPLLQKLEIAKINELKKKYLQDYPSEVLQPQNMPSTRLLSLAVQQHKKGDYRWIAWKFRISQDRLEEMAMARPNKQARLEALGLSSVLFDDVPAIEISNANMGISAVARLMALRDTAVSMVGSCHLSRLKSYTGRFIQLLRQRFDAESGLRSHNAGGTGRGPETLEYHPQSGVREGVVSE